MSFNRQRKRTQEKNGAHAADAQAKRRPATKEQVLAGMLGAARTLISQKNQELIRLAAENARLQQQALSFQSMLEARDQQVLANEVRLPERYRIETENGKQYLIELDQHGNPVSETFSPEEVAADQANPEELVDLLDQQT